MARLESGTEMRAMEKLIYDVGVNDGTDTAYYLKLGYRVVGVEASPVLAQELERTFADEIASGQFVLVNQGVAAQNGHLDFWMSDLSEWSSFNREIASRNGTPHRKVSVETRLFSEMVAEHGVPYFCKIDIEGNDSLCLAGLTKETAPEYISVEMSHGRGDVDLRRLRDLGYTKFKIISQVTRAQPHGLLTELGYVLPQKWSRRLRRFVRNRMGATADGDWVFPSNSSGAFAEQTPGPWRSYVATERMWRRLRDIDRRHGTNGLGEWFDFHACKG